MKTIATLALSLTATALHATGVDDFAVTLPLDADAARSAAWQVELGDAVHAWSIDEQLRDVFVFNADGHAVPAMAWSPSPRWPSHSTFAGAPLLALPPAPAGKPARDLAVVVERDAEGRLRSFEARDVVWSTATVPKRGWSTPRTEPAPPPVEAPAPPSGSREWLVDLAAFKHGVNGLVLAWHAPTDGVVARFAVEASDDLQQWRSMRNDATVVVLREGDVRIEHRTIPFERVQATYLRLRRLDAGPVLESLSVEVSLPPRGAVPPVLHWIPAQPAALAAASRHVDYTLVGGVPIEAMRVGFAQDNAFADFTLSTQATRTGIDAPWQPRKRFVAYRLRIDDVAVDSGEIPVGPLPRTARLRLEATSAVAAAPTLEVGYRPAYLVFLAEGPAPYRLAVGSVREKRNDAALEAVLATLRARSGADWQPPLATAGAVVEAAGKRALEAAPVDDGSARKLALWIVLVAGAALVAGLSLSLLRSARRKD